SSSFASMVLPSAVPSLFPYTTLFRSLHLVELRDRRDDVLVPVQDQERVGARERGRVLVLPEVGQGEHGPAVLRVARLEEVHRTRSEEHTSELQSRVDLVCRLLLEKKK